METSRVDGRRHATSGAGDPSRNYRYLTEVVGLREAGTRITKRELPPLELDVEATG